MAAVVDQRADFVDEPRAFLFLIHFAFGCGREKRRVNDDTIEGSVFAFHIAHLFKEIPGDEIPFSNGEAVERIRVFGEVEEFTVQVNLHHAAGSAFERGDPEAACVGKGVHDGSIF